MSEAAPERQPAYARQHLGVGWCALAVFGSIGIALELLHALKLPAYLGAGSETRRLLFRLGHAHGTLLGLVNLAFAATEHLMPARSGRARAIASFSLLGATAILPAGFFLGGAFIDGGDPGAGILLVPIGALLLVIGLGVIARRALAAGADHAWQRPLGDAADPPKRTSTDVT